jgi:pimeloyl-ACP methyl ester carboxylesterase
MTSKPRVGYAVLDQDTRLHAPFRYLPIVIVPGIMGSRLCDPRTGELVWNPLGAPIGDSPGAFTVKYDRLSQVSAELIPDEGPKLKKKREETEADRKKKAERDKDKTPDELEADRKKKVAEEKARDEQEKLQQIRHYYNLIPDFYGKLAKDLAALVTGEIGDYQIRPKVYCCGYDWRQDNAKSALRLAEVVEEALRETRERKVILVAHSMGGLVARYYCRILGGESKVHQVFLIGSPTLGAPSAYLQLKHGVTGLYLKDLKDDIVAGDTKGAVFEAMQGGSSLLSGVSSLAGGQGVGKSLKTFFGDIYAALCLGAGRYLSRKDTTYFVRQLPAIYQLIPGALYCSANKNWVFFDPLATGHPPTGPMLIFPTLLEAGLDLAAGALDALSGSAAKVGTELKDSVNGFLAPEATEKLSGRAKRNAKTLAEKIAEIGDAFSKVSDEPGKAIDALKAIKEIFDRAEQSFVDCTSNKQLYNDIYTGLLDVVEQRPICAGNLALAYRFDEALTVTPRPEKGTTPLALVKKIVDPILSAWGPVLVAAGGALVHTIFSSKHSWDYKDRMEDQADEKAKAEAEEKEEKERTRPHAYMHPRTVNIYCSSEQVESGCFLLPTKIISNDDSNLVRWEMIPNFIAQSLFMFLPAGASPTGSFEAQAFGDGTVPLKSANPDPASLSRELHANHEVRGVTHGSMASHQKVVDHITEGMQGLVMGFYKT